MTTAAAIATGRISELRRERVQWGERFFAAHSARIAELCHVMAERFARGGRLLAVGAGAADHSDACHVAVEFVHPVIVGKRALPALALEASDIELLARPDDIVIAFGDDEPLRAAVHAAGAHGCLTIGFAGGERAAGWVFEPASGDPFLDQELVETTYHVLWELVHVFFEHRGLLSGRDAAPVHDSGASSFLYPFLSEGEHDLGAILTDVEASVLAKAREIVELREQTLGEGAGELLEAAAALRAGLDGGGAVLALGNGGSATDAMDAVADLRHPPGGSGWPSRRALNLAGDPSILTAIANDIGTDALFSRQVIAYGQPGDTLLAISTSGNSQNVIAALAEARRRGLASIALVGYDGGQIAAERFADAVIVTRSQHIPRIQEAQASAWHVLRELVETGGAS